MKHIKKYFLSSILFMACVETSHAQLAIIGGGEVPVIDKTNLIQNVLTAVQTLAMMKMMITDLKKLAGENRELLSSLRSIESLLDEGEALSYISQADVDGFHEKFPGLKKYDERYLTKSKEWTRIVLDTISGTIKANNLQSQTLDQDYKVAGDMVEASNRAIGNLQATQAGTAISGEMLKQLIELRQTLISQTHAQNIATAQAVNRNAQMEAKSIMWLTAQREYNLD